MADAGSTVPPTSKPTIDGGGLMVDGSIGILGRRWSAATNILGYLEIATTEKRRTQGWDGINVDGGKKYDRNAERVNNRTEGGAIGDDDKCGAITRFLARLATRWRHAGDPTG